MSRPVGLAPPRAVRSPGTLLNRSSRKRLFAAGTAGALRAGSVVFVGTVVAAGAVYLFQLVAARNLTTAEFGQLSSLLAVLALATLPFSALQLAAARGVAGADASGSPQMRDALASSWLGLGWLLGLLCGLSLVIGAPIFGGLIGQENVLGLAIVGVIVLVSIPYAPLMGIAQARSMYGIFAGSGALGAMVRLVAASLLAVTALLSVNAALLATLVGALLAILSAYRVANLLPHIAAIRWGLLRPERRRTAAMVVGLLSVASLASLDVIVAQATLSAASAGTIAAAGLVARAGLYIPSAIIPVLQPRVAARAARGKSGADILWRSIAVTAVFGVVFAGGCFYFGQALIDFFVGGQFRDAAAILFLYALAMTAVAVGSLQVNYFLSRGDLWVAAPASFAVAFQVVLLMLFHGSVQAIVVVDLLSGIALVLACSAGVLFRRQQHRVRARGV